MTGAVLVVNAGSSSLKFAVYPDSRADLSATLRGKIAGIGANPVFSAQGDDGVALPQDCLLAPGRTAGLDTLVPALLAWVNDHRGPVTIRAVGHRVVHGGQNNAGPALITDALLAELETLAPLAPLHQPHNLAAIRHMAASAPGLPQVACFDTSFHRTQSKLAQMFALPRALGDQGIVRYGFHGLSYDHIARVLPHHLGAKAEGRVIIAHLGSGASMCALKDRRSVATTMGFTALDGLMMGQRCGALDPGVLLYLMAEKGMTVETLATLLYKESGLLGVSGISSDMAVLQQSSAPEAQEAINLFCDRAAGTLASLTTAIGGLDAIIFTAGIGENSAMVRSRICDRLRWMGVALDESANARHATRIGAVGLDIDVLVIPTDEEVVIARATQALTAVAPLRHVDPS